ncbi:penicillin-binding protein 2 [Aurantimonas aggregata]|uniref:Penicillin-binding protein 2 n=1 Tax=Aurantimonas aggregata TaxID=2047720 RepID=A0A6L9MNU5_9HYPH|nr:penicillin-binding protein 2 [Aurantimonas aggregata]NDV89068.1 penicillin-binding protein 2 [Aurantimonas aggregata]
MNVMRSPSQILIAGGVFVAIYAVIGFRLVQFGLAEMPLHAAVAPPPSVARPDIFDRNGNLLAMDLPVSSVYAEPHSIVDIDEAVEKLTAVLPDLDAADLYRDLSSDRGFTWIKRTISARERQEIWSLGIPSVDFRDETRRLYPNGATAAHVLGLVDVDNKGIAGIERWIDRQGLQDLKDIGVQFSRDDLAPVALSVDLRVQHALEDELGKAIAKFSAIAGAGLVMDVTNGEVIALASLPDFDPNNPADAHRPEHINRINVGVYEMGSTFKALTTAMALNSGRFNIHSVLDASHPLQFGRFKIRDFRGENRPLNVPEAFIHSSNIGMARMAMEVGIEGHKGFLDRFGQLDRLTTELPESASPIVPANWAMLNTATISFGHGLAVTSLQASMGIAALVNGGTLIRPTFVKDAPLAERVIRQDLVTPQTGEALRFMMRLNAEIGSARKADVPGYFMGGKTGTAEKVVNGRYATDRVLTSFMGIVPAHKPRYLFLVMLDEPKALPETHGFRTSGWNAVPVAGKIIERIMPILGVAPARIPPIDPFPAMSELRAFGSSRFQERPQPDSLVPIEASWRTRQ